VDCKNGSLIQNLSELTALRPIAYAQVMSTALDCSVLSWWNFSAGRKFVYRRTGLMTYDQQSRTYQWSSARNFREDGVFFLVTFSILERITLKLLRIKKHQVRLYSLFIVLKATNFMT